MKVNGKLHATLALPLGKDPGTNSIEGWAGPRVGLDVLEKRKASCPCMDLNPGPPSPSLVTVPAYRQYNFKISDFVLKN